MKKGNIDIFGLVMKIIKILLQGCMMFLLMWFFVFLLCWFMNTWSI